MATNRPKIGTLEKGILHIVWLNGSATKRQIQNQIFSNRRWREANNERVKRALSKLYRLSRLDRQRVSIRTTGKRPQGRQWEFLYTLPPPVFSSDDRERLMGNVVERIESLVKHASRPLEDGWIYTSVEYEQAELINVIRNLVGLE